MCKCENNLTKEIELLKKQNRLLKQQMDCINNVLLKFQMNIPDLILKIKKVEEKSNNNAKDVWKYVKDLQKEILSKG